MEADDQLGPRVRVAAEQEHVFGVERRAGAGEHLDEQLLRLVAVRGLGQGDQGLGHRRRNAGGVEIGAGVDRGHPPHEPGVVREGGEGVQRCHHPVARGRPVGHGVVRRSSVEDDPRVGAPVRCRVRLGPQSGVPERIGQAVRPHLRGAAAAEHGRRAGARPGGLARRHSVEPGPRRSGDVERLEAVHELPVDPVLQPHDPPALERASPLGAHRGSVAQVEQGEEIALRPVAAEPAPGKQAFQIVDEIRPHAHRVDAGAGALGVVDQRRAVADGEDAVVALHLQRRPRQHEAAVVERQVRAAEQGRRGGAGDPERQVGAEPVAASEPDRVRLHRRDLRPESGLDAAPARRGLDAPRQRRVVAGQDAVAGLDDRRSRFEPQAPQPRVDAEGQLDSARAAADDDDSRLPRPRPAGVRRRAGARQGLDPAFDLRRQPVDGPRGNRVLAYPRQVERGHGGTHVERGDVEGDGRPAIDEHPSRRCFHAHAGRQHHPDARPARQRHGVDLEFMAFVLARRQTRRHPGVDGDGRVDDERGVHGRGGVHDPVPQHLDVRVPGADQDDARAGTRCRPGYAELPARTVGRRGHQSAARNRAPR